MKTLTGTVISTKMDKTIIVEVKRQKIDPLYKKIIHRSRKYKVHNENQNIKEGDTVKIIETRPISGKKHYKVKEDKS